jgi:3-methyl-2-oxobutanoate hydroxymethyltransferase
MVYGTNQTAVSPRKKVRVTDVLNMKNQKKISSITCYDASFARLIEMSQMDFVLVGDSLGHVIQGHKSTLGVTIEDVAYHTRCVASALKTPLLVADMPFGSVGFDDIRTFKDAETLIRSGAEAVKIEGASAKICAQIKTLTENGIPVMGHVGLTPQSVHALGGYKVQGKNTEAQARLMEETLRLQEAGVFCIVFELVIEELANKLTKSLKVPSVGIGAGAGCDGQILVLQDMLGMNSDFKPKFLKHFAELEGVIVKSINDYCDQVCGGAFPAKSEV